VTKLYVEKESLAARGLTEDDLMPIIYEDENDGFAEKPSLIFVDRAEMARVMRDQDVVLSF
jgi:tRNA 2-thiouridine synthesizing protein C